MQQSGGLLLDGGNTLIESNPSISTAEAERREEIATSVCALVRNDISFIATSILFARHNEKLPAGSFFRWRRWDSVSSLQKNTIYKTYYRMYEYTLKEHVRSLVYKCKHLKCCLWKKGKYAKNFTFFMKKPRKNR